MIAQLTDVFPKDNTLIPLEVTHVITKFVDVFSENPSDKLPLMCDTQHTIESNLEEVIYQVDKKACDNSDDEHKGKDISHNCIRQIPSIHLPVITTAFSQLEEKNDGKGIVIFHAFTKIENQNCKVIVDRESYLMQYSPNWSRGMD